MVITDNGVWGSIFGLDGTNIQSMFHPKVNCNSLWHEIDWSDLIRYEMSFNKCIKDFLLLRERERENKLIHVVNERGIT